MDVAAIQAGMEKPFHMTAPPTDPDELYRYLERICICEESGVPHSRAVEIARAEAERQGTLLR